MSRRQAWAALDGRIWRMAAARAINTMGLSLVMAFLGVHLVEERGYPAWMYGAVALVANLGQSVSNAWAGALSDRIGRRPLITGGLTIRAGVVALLGVQLLLEAPLWSLALNVVVSSALRGCFEPVAYALVTDVAAPDQRLAAFGLQRMGTNLGWAAGPALGGVLALWLPYGAIFFCASAGLLGAAWITLGVADPVPQRRPRRVPTEAVAGRTAPVAVLDPHALDEPVSLPRSLAMAWATPAMRLLMIGTFLAALLHTQLFSTLAIFLTDEIALTKAEVGLLYTLNGGAVLLLQLPALALLGRRGYSTVLARAPLLAGVGFALVGLASGMPTAALAILVITCAEVLFDPAHQAAIADVADPAHRGRAYGVVGFAQMIGVAFAPLVGGLLFDWIGHHHLWMWGALGAIGLAQAAVFAAFLGRRR